MTHLYDYYKQKKISYNDWKAGILYSKIRHLYYRSTDIKDSLHRSSMQNLYETKGLSCDIYQSAQIENFWKGILHLSQQDPFPFLSILDNLTAPFGADHPIIEEHVKKALGKIRKIFKSIKLNDFLSDIENSKF